VMPKTELAPFWFISRNAYGRPTLSHALLRPHDLRSICGTYVSDWSKHFLQIPPPLLSCISCLRMTATITANPSTPELHLRAVNE
jgi:hypothetical protein